MKTVRLSSASFLQIPRRLGRAVLALLVCALLGAPAAQAAEFKWADSNVAGATPPSILDWLAGGANAQGAWIGGTPAGKPVNEQTAMQMTAVYSCVRILAETLAGLPLHVYRYNKSGGKEKNLKHPLYRLLHDEPNQEMTSFAFRETLMSHLLLWGNAYAQIIRNARGEVAALYPLMPNKMTVDRDSKGRLFYLYAKSGDDAPTLGNNNMVYLSPAAAEVWLAPESKVKFFFSLAKAKLTGEEPDMGRHFSLTF